MQPVNNDNFGPLIAYLVPGFTALWGASFFSETIHAWLAGTTADGPSIGGFLYVTLAALAAGLTVSTIRWAIIDAIHHRTGIPRPTWDFARMQQHFDAYDRLERNHYVYYQAYGNMVIAMTALWVSWRINTGTLQMPNFVDLAFVFLTVIFFAGSRDTLRKYYVRVSNLLCTDDKSNGNPRGIVDDDATHVRGWRDFFGLSGW